MSSSATSASKTEDVENESLSLFIPDVQTTSMLVHKAVDRYRWEHLKTEGSDSETERQGAGQQEEDIGTEKKYSSIMMPLQFGGFSFLVCLENLKMWP